MALPRENTASFPEHVHSMVGGVCQTRTALLDRLAKAVERLGVAKLSLEVDGESMSNQLTDLRDECDEVRRELATHRAFHGC